MRGLARAAATVALAALAVLAALGACSERAPAAPPAPPFEVFAVVEPAIAALQAELALPDVVPPDGRTRDDVGEEARGLASFLAGAPAALRDSALVDVRALGDAAVPALAALAVAEGAPAPERTAAIELLGALDSVRSAAQLLALLESSRDGWARSHAAWRLSQGTQSWIVPRAILRLKYETDHEAAVWLADAVARFGNLAGLGALEGVAASGATEHVRQLAASVLARLVGAADAQALAREGGSADVAGLRWAWSRWDGGPSELFEEPQPSKRRELEVWRWIRALGEFQLRGVDDARFVLSSLGPAAATQLARALHDESRYVRAHAAQCLERMGPRGTVAGPELVKALAHPEVAPYAAGALGRLAYPGAEEALIACTAPGRDLGLRIGAARALGSLGLASSVPALRALLAPGEPVDLRQAAAEGIAYCGAGGSVAELLCGFLESADVDPASSGAALRFHLAGLGRRGDAAAAQALERWDALEPPAGVVETAERIARRWSDRAALARAALTAPTSAGR